MIIKTCWCGSDYVIGIGYRDNYLIYECQVCGTWFVRETRDDYYEMYSRGDYQRQIQTSIGMTPYPDRYDHDLKVAEARITELMQFRIYGQSKKLVDVGCGNNALVDVARSRGFEAYGVDLDRHVEEHPFGYQMNIEAHPKDIIYGSKIITLYDTFEHLLEPLDTLRKIYNYLLPCGMLVIVAPDFSTPKAREQGLNWKHVRPEQHIFMIKPQLLAVTLKAIGFKTIDRRTPIPNQYALYARK